jgi:hypothetical protein
MFKKEYQEFCGEKDNITRNFFKDVEPDKYYLRYTRPETYYKH